MNSRTSSMYRTYVLILFVSIMMCTLNAMDDHKASQSQNSEVSLQESSDDMPAWQRELALLEVYVALKLKLNPNYRRSTPPTPTNSPCSSPLPKSEISDHWVIQKD